MADQSPSTLFHLDVNYFPKNQNPTNPYDKVIWHPLEHINGHVVIKSPGILDAERISIHLEGFSRVWIQALAEEDQILISASSYKFLHQSHDITSVERLQTLDGGCFTYIASFRLVIPRWAIFKTGSVPDQCISLPPSLSAGIAYRRPGEDYEYAQPNILYRLRAQVKLNSPHESTLPRVLEASKTIFILPCSLPTPPTDISDFPAEFISSASNKYRISLVGSWYEMVLSMTEPQAVRLKSTETSASVDAVICVEIKAPGSAIDATSMKKLSLRLNNLLFKMQPILRAKTFYSTGPFQTLPCQNMLSLRGSVRLKDEIMKLQTQDVKAHSWQHDRVCQVHSSPEIGRSSLASAISASMSTVGSANISKTSLVVENPSKVLSTHLSMHVTVQSNLPPTFCTVNASRQYSLITRIRIGGAKIKDFVLEVPLQIVYSPSEDQEKGSAISTCHVQPSSTSNSRVYDILHEADHPDEDLPGYS